MARTSAQKIFAGTRLRRLRRDLGLSQVQMASGLEISPAYLNLLESDQRPVSAQLLLKLADAYNVNLKGLTGDEGARTLVDLKELFSDPLLEAYSPSAQDLFELQNASPVVTQALITLYRSYRSACDRINGLAERIAGLGSDIRTENGAYPVEEVRDFFAFHRNHFPEIETAAGAFWDQALSGAETVAIGLRSHLKTRHSTTVQVMPVEFMEQLLRRYDRHSNRLFLTEALPLPARNFQIAYHIGLTDHSATFDQLIDAHAASKGIVISADSRRLLRISLANYFAGAVLMPYGRFLKVAETKRYDIELLAQRFDVSYEQVCHRLTTLHRVGNQGVPFFFIRVDPAGNISKRLGAGGFHFARFGGACPRWNLHEAFRSPGKIITQIIETPDRSRYFSVARTVDGLGGGYHVPSPQMAIGLGCEISQAHRLVYSDGWDLTDLKRVTPIGMTCRLCERTGCSQRAFPPLSRTLILDESLKTLSPFMFHSGDK
jgi:XRE family transcriptional regulator, fatty acid utilization regulator